MEIQEYCLFNLVEDFFKNNERKRVEDLFEDNEEESHNIDEENEINSKKSKIA